MKIAEGKNVKLGIFDIETYLELFDIGIFDPDTNQWVEFEISKYRNDLYKLVKHYIDNEYDYWVSFNGVNFDHQVLEYIVDNCQDWYDLSGLEICKIISDFSSKIIEDGRYDIPPPYKEWNFRVSPIDLFKIHHFDNKARRTSLKWVEFMLNMDVEEMPIHHRSVGLSQADIAEVKLYRRHDVKATYQFLLLTLGETELPELKDYKGKNKIQDRFDVMNETGMNCLNWSDVKIGEEWNKLDYKNKENLKDDKTLFDRKIKQPYGQPFKKFFPSTMEFKTPLFKDFVKMLGEEKVRMNRKGKPKQEYQLVVGKTTYTIAKGGLHSTEKHRTIIPPPGFNYDDIDVGSQYPNSAIKLLICAPHLNVESMIGLLKGKVKNRFIFKDKAKELKEMGKDAEARPYSSVQEMLKLCLNGGYYGKLGQEGSFLQYPEGLLKICMGNQIEILMLIEMMEMAGFQVLSGNTDGITVLYPTAKKDEFLQICSDWENKVGNHTMGKLEHTPFTAVWQESINHYLAKKTDGKIKKKGRFATEFEINKNKSKRIIAMAVEKYFIDGVSPVDFITSHDNIYDFCAAVKATGQLHYEEIKGKEIIFHKKLVRYYVCKEGSILMKRGKDFEGNPMNNHCEAEDKDFPWMGQPLIKYFNRVFTVGKFSDYNVDYSYYILQTLKRIDAIQKTKMAKNYADTFKSLQTSLF